MNHDAQTYRPDSPVLAPGESILWSGKPKRLAFIATKSLTLLPLVLIWLFSQWDELRRAFQGGRQGLDLLEFCILGMLPVWLWLGNVLTAGRQWKNTNYFITNRRIIFQRGIFQRTETCLYRSDLRSVDLSYGLLDNVFHTADIAFDDGIYRGRRNRSRRFYMEDMAEPQETYRRIQIALSGGY